MADEFHALTANEVEEYLARIHFTGPIEPTLDILKDLQKCHMLSVPFENLSVFGKEEIVLSKDWLFDKVVQRHRGGYCYELNSSFSLLLDHFGYSYGRKSAAVYSRKSGLIASSIDHLINVINIGDEMWLSDVGFGESFLTPLLIDCSADEQEQQSGTYRIRKDGDQYFYEEKVKTIVDEFGNEEKVKEKFIIEAEWAIRYRFDLTPRKIEDFHERLIYHQTDPKSPFTHDRICTLAKPWGRLTLSENKLITSTYLGDNKVKKETEELSGEEEIVNELAQKFGIRTESCLYPEGSMYHGLELK